MYITILDRAHNNLADKDSFSYSFNIITDSILSILCDVIIIFSFFLFCFCCRFCLVNVFILFPSNFF